MNKTAKLAFLLAISLLTACEPHGVFYQEETVFVPRTRSYVSETRVYVPQRNSTTKNEQTTLQTNQQQQSNSQNIVIHNHGSPQAHQSYSPREEDTHSRPNWQNSRDSATRETTQNRIRREQLYLIPPQVGSSGASEKPAEGASAAPAAGGNAPSSPHAASSGSGPRILPTSVSAADLMLMQPPPSGSAPTAGSAETQSGAPASMGSAPPALTASASSTSALSADPIQPPSAGLAAMAGTTETGGGGAPENYEALQQKLVQTVRKLDSGDATGYNTDLVELSLHIKQSYPNLSVSHASCEATLTDLLVQGGASTELAEKIAKDIAEKL